MESENEFSDVRDKDFSMPGEKIDADTRRRQILDTTFLIASRDRLDGVSIRGVASEAGISMGLVSFYFGSKEGLLARLLERVVDTIFTHGFQAANEIGSPNERLFAVVENTLTLVLDRTGEIHILLDFWLRAGQHARISDTIQSGLAAFRESIREIAAEMIAVDPVRFAGTSAEGIAAVAMSTIEGTMFQEVLFPGQLDKAQFLSALDALLHDVSPTQED